MVFIQDIYKVHEYDATGDVNCVYVFCAGQKNAVHLPELFTQEILDTYAKNDVTYVFTTTLLYPTDTMDHIKYKIMCAFQEQSQKLVTQSDAQIGLNPSNPSVDEMYLFSWKSLSPNTILRLATDVPLDVLLHNTDVPDALLGQIDSVASFAALTQDTPLHIIQSMGLGLPDHVVKQPFLATNHSSEMVGESVDESTHILLQYDTIINNDLFLCFRDADSSNLRYFPKYSTKRGVEDSKYTLGIHDHLHLLQYSSTAVVPYLSRGISTFTMVLNVSGPTFFSGAEERERSTPMWPLETIFKQMHATQPFPIVMLNPGRQRENVVRLFCTNVSKNGRRIPLMTKKELIKIMNELGNPSDTLFAYIPIPHNDNDDGFILVWINKFGRITVSCRNSQPLSHTAWNEILQRDLNPYLDTVHDAVRDAGYTVERFVTLADTHITTLQCSCSLQIQEGIELTKQIPCITDIFDIYNDGLSNEQDIILRYKRSHTYSAKDAQHRLIQFVMKHHPIDSQSAAIASLKMNHSLTESQALTCWRNYVEPSSEDGPLAGMLVRFSLRDQTLTITAEGLTAIGYMDELFTYLEGIVRITQPSLANTFTYPIHSLCEKMEVQTTKGVKKATSIPSVPIKVQEEVEYNDNLIFDDSDDDDQDQDQDHDQDNDQDNVGSVAQDISTPKASKKIPMEGMKLNGYFLKRMQAREPKLFVYDHQDGYQSYSRMCSAADRRQPVILTPEEFQDIEKNHRDAYTESVQYGSHYYICPRYWCMETQKPMTEEEVASGKCGQVLPADAKQVTHGNYIYHFDSKKEQHRNVDGKYVMNSPGFLKQTNPSQMALPCCFKVTQEKKKRAPTWDPVGFADIKYVISPSTFPIPAQRWGFLPLSVQHFLKTSNDDARLKDSQTIAPNKPCFLRYGVEFSEKQSFLACMADLYAYKQHRNVVPSVAEMRTIVGQAMTIDLFAKYHRGNLVSAFLPTTSSDTLPMQTYQSSPVLRQLQEPQQRRLVAAYENFLAFLSNPTASIDHTYVWDIVVDANPQLMIQGLNLVILELLDNDVTDNVSLICSTHSSFAEQDPSKETVILLKRGVFYEPIYHYHDIKRVLHINKGFVPNQFENITKILSVVRQSTKKYCASQSSQPTLYTFSHNLPATTVHARLTESGYHIIGQMVNYREQNIGWYVETQDKFKCVIPCHPSGIAPDVVIYYMDDNSIWTDYATTIRVLREVAKKTKLKCLPRFQLVDEGAIVGLLTETNQYVQVNPPLPEDAGQVDIPILHQDNYMIVDKTLSTAPTGDQERILTVKRLQWERQFFAAFRITVREQIHHPQHRNILARIKTLLQTSPVTKSPSKLVVEGLRPSGDDKSAAYKETFLEILSLIHSIVDPKHVVFQDMSMDVLTVMDDLVGCVSDTSNPFCLSKKNQDQNQKRVLVLPKTNLIHGKDNETLYFGRICDELVRNQRIRYFLLDASTYYHGAPIQYKVNNNELLILLSLVEGYMEHLEPYFINEHLQSMPHEFAQPYDTHVAYSNTVSLEEQQNMLDANKQDQGKATEVEPAHESDSDSESESEVEPAPEAVVESEVEPTVVEPTLEVKPEVAKKKKFVVLPNTNMIDMSNILPSDVEIVGEFIDIKVNRTTSYWVFPMSTQEIVFPNTNFGAIQYILHSTGHRYSTEYIKEILSNSRYMTLFPQACIAIFEKQQKKLLMKGLQGGKGKDTLQNRLQRDDYYLSDLDMWIIASELALPLVLFAGTTLKHLVADKKWVYMSSKLEDINTKLYFMRSNTTRIPNSQPVYTVITPTLKISELKNGSEGRTDMEMAMNEGTLVTLETFLQS